MITVYGANTTIDEVRNIPLTTPTKAGGYWKGIPHGELVDTISDEVRSRGWKITEELYCLSKDGADLAGAFSLTIPHLDSPEGQAYSLGFLTSNAMRRSLTMVVGTTVEVCSNGMATGEIVLCKKHTTNFDIITEVDFAVGRYLEKAKDIPALVTRLRGRDLKPVEAEHVLMEAGRAKLMPWSRIGDVDKEYHNPHHTEHGLDTSWALLNAFTYTVKRNPPQQQMDQMNGFRALLPLAPFATAV